METHSIIIRDIEEKDIGFVLFVNQVNVEVLSPMDEARLRYFMDISEMCKVVEVDGVPAAFLIGLREGSPDYDSENYIWFSRHYDRFLYVDRIVIAREFWRLGIGSMIYQEVFRHARETGVPVVTLEVDLIPYNAQSLGFHEAMGFHEVGQQVIRGGEIKVSLQTRDIE